MQKVLAGIGAVIVGGVIIAFARSRKRKKDIEEIQKLLAARVV